MTTRQRFFYLVRQSGVLIVLVVYFMLFISIPALYLNAWVVILSGIVGIPFTIMIANNVYYDGKIFNKMIKARINPNDVLGDLFLKFNKAIDKGGDATYVALDLLQEIYRLSFNFWTTIDERKFSRVRRVVSKKISGKVEHVFTNGFSGYGEYLILKYQLKNGWSKTVMILLTK